MPIFNKIMINAKTHVNIIHTFGTQAYNRSGLGLDGGPRRKRFQGSLYKFTLKHAYILFYLSFFFGFFK